MIATYKTLTFSNAIPIMKYMIEDFIHETNVASSHDEVFSLYRKAIENFGYDSSIYTFITDHPNVNQKAGHGVKNNYPEDWMKHYFEKGYSKIDPVVANALKGTPIFTWDKLVSLPYITKEQKKILNEAEDSGLRNGIGIPLYSPKGEIAGVGLASTSSEKYNPDRDILCKLKILTEQFHSVYCSLSAIKNDYENEVKLSNREIEIMKWWAVGKTADEISTILGCTKSNVKFHISNIYNKLEANTKIYALSKAVRLGIIPFYSC